MDFTRLSQGEKVAGVSGILLILFMFIFDWFGFKFGAAVPVSLSAEVSGNAWGAYGFTDIVLFITALAAIGLVLLAASESEMGLPVAASAIVAGLGVLSVVLVIISIISPPDFGSGVDLSGTGIEHTRKIGVWLGLIAAAGVAVGGYMAMQEEGTSFGSEAGRFGGGGDAGAGSPPPPPPPTSSAPPPSSPPPSNP